MFWPTGKHRFGWFLEPAYDYSFAGGHQQSLGISGGLLIGIPGPHRNRNITANDFRKGRSGNPAKIGKTHALPQRKLLQRSDWQPNSTRIRRQPVQGANHWFHNSQFDPATDHWPGSAPVPAPKIE